MRPHPPLHAAYARRFRWMGCQAARRGASAALLEVRQEAMHGTDVRTDEATRLQESLKAMPERANGKIDHHRKVAIMENHKALDETIVLGRIDAELYLNNSNGPTGRRMAFGRRFVQLKYFPVIRVHPISLSAPHRR